MMSNNNFYSFLKKSFTTRSSEIGVIGLGLVRKTYADLGMVLTAQVPAVGQATITAIPFNEC